MRFCRCWPAAAAAATWLVAWSKWFPSDTCISFSNPRIIDTQPAAMERVRQLFAHYNQISFALSSRWPCACWSFRKLYDHSLLAVLFFKYAFLFFSLQMESNRLGNCFYLLNWSDCVCVCVCVQPLDHSVIANKCTAYPCVCTWQFFRFLSALVYTHIHLHTHITLLSPCVQFCCLFV